MRRPFITRYSPGYAPGTLQAAILCKSSINAEDAQILMAAGRKFKDLADSGALSGDRIEPEQSSIGHADTAIRDATATWTFSSVRIDPLSLSVLANIVEYIHDKFVPVGELHVNWSSIGQVKNPTKVEFPEPYGPVPFIFSYDDTISSFDIVLDLATAQRLEHVEEIERVVGAWFSAANLGAYGDDSSRPPINQIYFSPDVSTVTEESIVWHIDRFACGSQAIDGLVNVVTKVHRTQAPVRSLEIGA